MKLNLDSLRLKYRSWLWVWSQTLAICRGGGGGDVIGGRSGGVGASLLSGGGASFGPGVGCGGVGLVTLLGPRSSCLVSVLGNKECLLGGFEVELIVSCEVAGACKKFYLPGHAAKLAEAVPHSSIFYCFIVNR